MVIQLENYKLRSPICKDCQDLNALMQISNLISITGEFSAVLKKCIEQIKDIMGVTSGGVLLYDTRINKLVLQRPAFGMDNEKFQEYSLEVIGKEKPGMGAAVKVFITGRPHISNHPLNDSITKQEIVDYYNVRCALTVPLVVNKECLGVLHLINTYKGYFSQEDARLALLLASQLAVVIDNTRTFAQMEAKNRLLLRATEIHNQLTKMVLLGNGLEAITKTLSRLLGRPIQVEDQYLRPLAYGRPSSVDQSEAPGPETINGEALCNPEVQSFLKLLQKEKRALPFPNQEQYGLKTARIMSAIQVGTETLGYVSVMAACGFLEELDFMAVEHAATVYALQFMQQKVAFEVEERIIGQFVEDLVYGRIKEENEILNKAGYLGYNLHHYYYVMIICINENGNVLGTPHENSEELSKYSHILVDLVRRIVCEQGFKVITARSNPLLVLVDTGAAKQKQKVHKLAEKIHQSINKKLKKKCTIGISRAAMGLNELKISYKQAEKAFQIANKLRWHYVVPYESLGVFRVFMQVENQEVLKSYLYEILGALLAYDQEKKGNLLETLRVYADSNFNNQRTANRLFIHINTLKYRLERIREIGKLNLDSSEERLNIQLAMKIMDMLDDLDLPKNTETLQISD